MQEITIKAYSFDELSNEAKEKALEWARDFNVSDSFWYEGVYEKWKLTLGTLGFTDVKIWFSGFWSQGDGACFDGKVDVDKWLTARKVRSKYKILIKPIEEGKIYGSISKNGFGTHYSHSKTRYVSLEVQPDDLTPAQHDKVKELEKEIEEDREQLSDQIYDELEKEHEYLTSDESVAGTIRANEYLFTADGLRSKTL